MVWRIVVIVRYCGFFLQSCGNRAVGIYFDVWLSMAVDFCVGRVKWSVEAKVYGKVDGVGETMFIGKVKGKVGIDEKS